MQHYIQLIRFFQYTIYDQETTIYNTAFMIFHYKMINIKDNILYLFR